MFYIGWDREYLAVISLSQYSNYYFLFFKIEGFHFANQAIYLPRLPNTMVGELGRYYDRIGAIAKI